MMKNAGNDDTLSRSFVRPDDCFISDHGWRPRCNPLRFIKGLPALTWAMVTQVPQGGFYLGKGGGALNAILGSLYLAVEDGCSR